MKFRLHEEILTDESAVYSVILIGDEFEVEIDCIDENSALALICDIKETLKKNTNENFVEIR